MPTATIVMLQEVTKKKLDDILDLKVTSEQENFVASNAVSIAEAHFDPDVAWLRAIYVNETPVGFVLLHDDPTNSYYLLWRFMIDARFQKCGFGQRALELVIEYVKTRPRAEILLTACVPGEQGPEKFYEKMGFTSTNEIDEGELIMQYKLNTL